VQIGNDSKQKDKIYINIKRKNPRLIRLQRKNDEKFLQISEFESIYGIQYKAFSTFAFIYKGGEIFEIEEMSKAQQVKQMI